MPGPYTTPERLAIFDLLMNQAIVVPKDDLQQILRMEVSLRRSPGTAPSHHFYVRSWTFNGTELSALLRMLAENETHFKEADAWQTLLDRHFHDSEGAPSSYTIRYVGTVDGPMRPIDHHYDDLWNRKTKVGILGEFLRTVEEICPKLAAAVQVHLLPDASLPEGPFLNADDVERVLIRFFHLPTLLNRRRGGYYGSYVPPAEDAQTFRELQTDFWFRFTRNAGLPFTTTTAKVTAHFQAVQQYTNDNPAECGTGVVGKDQTLEEFLSSAPYINGGSRSGRLTRDFLYRLVKNEAQAHRRHFTEDSFDPTFSPWCFVDMWPWLWHKNTVRAAGVLRWFLSVVSPLIVVTYGRLVASVTRANFQVDSGVRQVNMSNIAAMPTIQYSQFDELTHEALDDSAFIAIPHMHPGTDKYGDQNPILRRFLDLTLQYTFLFGHVALTAIDAIPDDPGEQPWPTRKALCEHILQHVNDLCTTSPPHQRFYQRLQEARNDLIKHW